MDNSTDRAGFPHILSNVQYIYTCFQVLKKNKQTKNKSERVATIANFHFNLYHQSRSNKVIEGLTLIPIFT